MSNGPEREEVGPARSAGYEEIERDHPTGVAPDLPFEPESVPVDDLPGALEGVGDEDVLHELQRVDTRTTAAAHYERRIAELEEPPEES